MTKEEAKPDRDILLALCNMGVPMGLQYSITAIGSVVLQTAVNGLGSMAVAAVTAGTKISMFFCCPFDALGSTMATYGGQNIGARKLDRISRGLKAASVMGCVYAVFALGVLFVFGRQISLLFLDRGQTEILGQVQMFLIGNSLFYIPLAFVNIVRFLIHGDWDIPSWLYWPVCVKAGRAFVGFCLVPVLGYAAVCFASPAAWIAADAFLIPSYIRIMKKLKAMPAYQCG